MSRKRRRRSVIVSYLPATGPALVEQLVFRVRRGHSVREEFYNTGLCEKASKIVSVRRW